MPIWVSCEITGVSQMNLEIGPNWEPNGNAQAGKRSEAGMGPT